MRLPPVLGGGDSQYFLEDTREGAGAGEARAESDLFHAPAVARHQQLGTGVVHPVAVDVFLERDVQFALMEVERYFSLVPRARTKSCRLKFGLRKGEELAI